MRESGLLYILSQKVSFDSVCNVLNGLLSLLLLCRNLSTIPLARKSLSANSYACRNPHKEKKVQRKLRRKKLFYVWNKYSYSIWFVCFSMQFTFAKSYSAASETMISLPWLSTSFLFMCHFESFLITNSADLILWRKLFLKSKAHSRKQQNNLSLCSFFTQKPRCENKQDIWYFW